MLANVKQVLKSILLNSVLLELINFHAVNFKEGMNFTILLVSVC